MNAHSGGFSRARAVLGVRLDTIGDVLMTTPALRALKESLPGRRIALLTSPPGAEIARLVPEIDEVIAYDAPWMKSALSPHDPLFEYDLIERLRQRDFDAAAIFTVYSQSPLPAAMLCYLAGIPLRLAHCRENPYLLLSHWVKDPEPQQFMRHEVRRQLDLVASVGCATGNERLSLNIPRGNFERVVALLRELRLNAGEPFVVVHSGGSAPSRRYPEESFAAVTRYLVRERGVTVIFTGTASERPIIRNIRTRAGVDSRSLAGRLSVGELAALISLSTLLISNNTGPVHIAAAVGTKVVDLYALTNPQHTPWGVSHRVLSFDVPCKYCYKSVCPKGHNNCLRLIPPDDVTQAARELLDASAAPAEAIP